MRGPNANGFALQWNRGLRVIKPRNEIGKMYAFI